MVISPGESGQKEAAERLGAWNRRASRMSDLAPVLGVAAGVVAVADTIPYVRDTVRGTTRPHRGTWLIWGTLAIVVCLSQRADGPRGA